MWQYYGNRTMLKERKGLFLYTIVLTSPSVCESSGISSWNGGGFCVNINDDKKNSYRQTHTAAKREQTTEIKMQNMPDVATGFLFNQCEPATIAPDPFLCSHGNS